ncbi:hypothetical protein PP7435_CHR3-0189 [Komagataella phaffii CBS 7435]|uniref:non-specific serine/threonine protein kinase n=2 Tax=Komagataella phaffii TaxID=460519 RepID=C4R658_KOMPG|nr:uncharacterized protein PAS_chr3_0980 [Komagataella phaffii GS115]AOA63930.1 GQ67_04111T0 [Komagataella phaffii]CAH2449128.1 hypothetical protein BQ9382_C3-1060 [Komagataella phaffii CBS 7435]AOA68726.1 GQ68_04084T0 [Komagataella phaffii GS115]CAY71044.1 Putative serine/threonine protein kinase with unknown cellular role [Komagataella phaffii GS115]CCA39161.1 hypothetical protein PP7435_CHR3-0189 [Komagataella phaffii CBS 7435]
MDQDTDISEKPVEGSSLKVLPDQPISTGLEGIIYKAEYHGVLVVAKKMTKPLYLCKHEAGLIKKAGKNNENVCKVIDLLYEEDGSSTTLILPFYPNGDLLSFLVRIRKQKLSVPQVLRDLIFMKVVNIINLLHAQNIVHMDIKPENILIDGNGQLILCDFGFARDVSLENSDHPIVHLGTIVGEEPENAKNEHKTQVVGTKSFMAPEIFSSKKKPSPQAMKKYDVWSLGILYFVIALTCQPWNSATPQDPIYEDYSLFYTDNRLHSIKSSDLNNNYIRKAALKPFRQLPYNPRDCILKCLNPDNATRYTVKDICQSTWFADLAFEYKSSSIGSEILKIIKTLNN